MDVQRLRNLTTGIVHTEDEHIPQDIEFLTGVPGVTGEMIPTAIKALKPWLHSQIDDDSMWGSFINTSDQGELDIEPMKYSEKKAFFKRFAKLYDDFCCKAGKTAPIRPDNCFVAPMYNPDNISVDFGFTHISHNPCITQNSRSVRNADGSITITALEDPIKVSAGCAQSVPSNLKGDQDGVVTVALKNGKTLKFPAESSSISYKTVPITKHGFGEPLFAMMPDESDKQYRERLIDKIRHQLPDDY